MPYFVNPLESGASDSKETDILENTVDIINFDTVSYESKSPGFKKSFCLNVYNYEKVLMSSEEKIAAHEEGAFHSNRRDASIKETSEFPGPVHKNKCRCMRLLSGSHCRRFSWASIYTKLLLISSSLECSWP